MKLQEVIDNLNRTIAGKIELKEYLERSFNGELFARMVEINIDELNRILIDLLKVQTTQNKTDSPHEAFGCIGDRS